MSCQVFVSLFRYQDQTEIINVTSIRCLFYCIHWQDLWWSKRAKYWSLLHCILIATREQWLSCFFLWVQVSGMEICFVSFLLGVMFCRTGRGRGIPQGVQGNPFIWRLTSCLRQIPQSLKIPTWFKESFYPESFSHLKWSFTQNWTDHQDIITGTRHCS